MGLAFFLPLFGPAKLLASSDPAESFMLPNGLRVILKTEPGSPLAALQLWVEAGAADEEAEEAGLAHLVEHILFRGSSDKGTGKLAAEIESSGGRINGFTSRDHTVYHTVLPSTQLTKGIRVLGEMTQLPSLSEGELEKEIQVVLEEWKQSQDTPRSRAAATLFRTSYLVHPYGRPVIGRPETLERIGWERVSRFHQRWYRPNNMILVAVGGFDPESAKKELAESFGSLPPAALPTRRRPAEPIQTELRLSVQKTSVRQARLTLGFPIPKAGESEGPALDLLAFVLGRGESSRLAQRVKIEAGLVSSISASTFVFKGPGLFFVQASLEAERLMEALKTILKEIYRLRQEEVGPGELQRARVNFARSFMEAKESVEGQARQLAAFQSLYGYPDYQESYLREIERVDGERLRGLAQRFLRTERLSISILLPEGSTQEPNIEEIARLSRDLESPPPAPVVRRRDGILSATLDNGLRILVKENRRLPVVAIHAGVIGGLLLEEEKTNGLHRLIASMLTQGSRNRSANHLVQEVEQLGGSLSGAAGNSTLSLTGTFPSRQAERGLEIFLESLFHPTFPAAELEKKRREILTNIKTRQERARSQALSLFYQTLFEHHPYRLNPSGQGEAMQTITRQDLIAHYRRLVSPERVVLSIVGDLDGEKAIGFLQAKLSSIPKGSFNPILPASEPASDEARVRRKALRTRQAHLVLGFPAPALGKEGYFAMKVVQTILSRLGGRLFVDLRDTQGLAYAVGAFSLSDPFQGAFGIYAATDPGSVEAMKEGILKEIQRLQEKEVAAEELERAKNYLFGDYLISRQTNASLAEDLTLNELFGLGSGYARLYREQIEKITSADILRFARDHLPLDRYVFAVVGP